MLRILFQALVIAIVPAPASVSQAQVPGDPCTIFTKAELEAAFGYPLQPGRLKNSGTECGYNGRNNPGISIHTDTVSMSAEDFLQAQTMLEGKPVSGIGDAAFFFLSRLYVRVGRRSFTISAGLDEDPSPKVKAALTALGKTAVARAR